MSSVHILPQLASAILTLAVLVAMILLDRARIHIRFLQVALPSAALGKGIGSAEVAPLHFHFVVHLLLLIERHQSLLV